MSVPGPGAYKPLEFVGKEAPAPSVHAKLSYKPIEQTGGTTPGPGAYESTVKNRRTAPSYSPGFEQRKPPGNKNALAQPAANAYNPSLTFTQKQGAKWGFGSEMRHTVGGKTIAPGPGNYEIKPKAFNHANPRFFMGQKLAPPKATTDVPGAGAYDPTPEKTKKNLPAYSMKMKLDSSLKSTSISPGPGNYNFEAKNKESAPKYGFGTSTRKEPKGLNVPGPGSYKINSKISELPQYAMPNQEKYKYV